MRPKTKLLGLTVLLLCSNLQAQSFLVSQGRESFVKSGADAPEQTVIPEKAELPGRFKFSGKTPSLPAPAPDWEEIFEDKPVIPTTPPKPVVAQPAVQKRNQQWYLVSEEYCQACPAAKSSFRRRGWPEQNIISLNECQRRFGFRPSTIPYEFSAEEIVQPTVVSVPQPMVVQQQLPIVDTPWGRQNLATYEASHRGCNCPMCKGVRAIINDYRRQPQPVLVYPPQSKTFGQEPTPPEVVNEMVDNLLLRPSDTLMDLGCGDGRILIAAVRNSGCRAVGIELDPLKAAEARTRVEAAGLSSRIKVVTGDALAFDPRAYGATVLTAFLYPELLEKLKPKFSQVDRFATPYHQVPGLAMVKFGEVWYGPS